MPIAAVPGYLGDNFSDASPGLRFGMYLKLWGINRRTQEKLWKPHDLGYEARGQQQQEREVKYENKVSALTEAKKLGARDKGLMKHLVTRQSVIAQSIAADVLLRLDTIAISPFSTGLGNEHPLENGFSFLNPYGIPYLPASGVKGVLRQAARELASGEWGETRGWDEKVSSDLSVVDILFGLESKGGEMEHLRGALTFWDVIPQIKGDSLMVEIMTPHQSHYYQQKRDRKTGDSIAPHDSGQPTPISFLTVPPGSEFVFFVTCDTPRLVDLAQVLVETNPTIGKPYWQALMISAFEHAFQWLGFGAKTAVGYGAMVRDIAAEERRENADKEREIRRQAALEREAALAQLNPVERTIIEFLDSRPNKNQPEISAVISEVKNGRWQGDDRISVARWLAARMKESKGQWKESSQAKKPEKDKEYQNTLLVKSWLEGK